MFTIHGTECLHVFRCQFTVKSVVQFDGWKGWYRSRTIAQKLKENKKGYALLFNTRHL